MSARLLNQTGRGPLSCPRGRCPGGRCPTYGGGGSVPCTGYGLALVAKHGPDTILQFRHTRHDSYRRPARPRGSDEDVHRAAVPVVVTKGGQRVGPVAYDKRVLGGEEQSARIFRIVVDQERVDGGSVESCQRVGHGRHATVPLAELLLELLQNGDGVLCYRGAVPATRIVVEIAFASLTARTRGRARQDADSSGQLIQHELHGAHVARHDDQSDAEVVDDVLHAPGHVARISTPLVLRPLLEPALGPAPWFGAADSEPVLPGYLFEACCPVAVRDEVCARPVHHDEEGRRARLVPGEQRRYARQ